MLRPSLSRVSSARAPQRGGGRAQQLVPQVLHRRLPRPVLLRAQILEDRIAERTEALAQVELEELGCTGFERTSEVALEQIRVRARDPLLAPDGRDREGQLAVEIAGFAHRAPGCQRPRKSE